MSEAATALPLLNACTSASSPCASPFHVLRYVERAKDIVNTTTVNDASSNPLIGKLREEVRALREQLIEKDAIILEHEVKYEACAYILLGRPNESRGHTYVLTLLRSPTT